MKSKILITGGSGKIGSGLALYLSKEYQVTVLDRKITRKFPKRIKTLECDLTKVEAKKFLKDQDYIFHLASIKPGKNGLSLRDSFKAIQMTENVAKFNLGAKVIYSSAGTIYGIKRYFPIKENASISCWDYYCLSKIESEKILESYSELRGWPLVILRITNVYGPELKRRGEILPEFFKSIMKNQPLKIFGNGRQKRDRIWIDDLLEAFRLSMKVEGIFNIGSGESFSSLEVAKMMSKLLKKPFNTEFFQAKTKRKDNLLDISKAKKDMKFKPKVNFRKGLKILLSEWKKYEISQFERGL